MNDKSVCVKSENVNRDPNCAEFTGNICTKCAKGSFFNKNGTCETSNPYCRQFNILNGKCIGCYTGFKLNTITNNCDVESKKNVTTNQLCAEWNL